MKRCPRCDEALVADTYDGIAVWRCAKCRGVLLQKFKLEMIRHRQQRSADLLTSEAKTDFSADTKKVVRCPRCREHMEKRPLVGYFKLTLDLCKACDAIWLDGGELAIAQLAFTNSARGRDLVEQKKRAAALEADPERKARFDEAFSKLPEKLPGSDADTSAPLAADVASSILELIARATIR